MSEQPKLRYQFRRYQFSLRTLLLLMTVFTVTFGGWVQYSRYRAKDNRERLAAHEAK